MKFIIPVVLLACPVLCFGHHSKSEYNFDVLTELTGEVLSVSWRNPHIQFTLRNSDTDEEWFVEASSAIDLNALNVRPSSLRPGMNVTVAGGASARRANRLDMTNVLLPSGVEIVTRPQFPARWSETVITRAKLYEPSGALPDDGRGIFRVWSWQPVTEFWMIRPPNAYSLTDAARAAVAEWDEDDPEDNLILQCIDPGMPSVMGNPHPMELVELDGAIEIRNEEFDSIRTIHMDSSVDPSSVPLSPLGYSVGRWEGDTLVVQTTRLNAPYFNRLGIPQSEAAEVEERFSVNPDEGKLYYVLTVTDPVNLTEPFVHELEWNWKQDAHIQRYDCQVNE